MKEPWDRIKSQDNPYAAEAADAILAARKILAASLHKINRKRSDTLKSTPLLSYESNETEETVKIDAALEHIGRALEYAEKCQRNLEKLVYKR